MPSYKSVQDCCYHLLFHEYSFVWLCAKMWSLCQAEGYWKDLVVVARLDETTSTFQKKSENLQVRYCFKNCVCMHDWPREELRSRALSFLFSDVKMHNFNRVSNAESCKWEKNGNREEAPFENKLELENNPRNDVIKRLWISSCQLVIGPHHDFIFQPAMTKTPPKASGYFTALFVVKGCWN